MTSSLSMLENVSVIQAEEKKTCLQHGKNLEGIEIVQWLQAESRNRKKHMNEVLFSFIAKLLVTAEEC